MTPEQERAEARIDRANIIAWLKHMIERHETMEADGEASAYKFTLGRIQDGKFDINSLDREEQLIAENERLKENYGIVKQALNNDQEHHARMIKERFDLQAKVAEQDKEIQRLEKDYSELEDQAATWREESGN